MTAPHPSGSGLRWAALGLAVIAAVIAGVVGFVVMIPALIESATDPCGGGPTPTAVQPAAAVSPVPGYTPEQLGNAAQIMRAAADLGLDVHGQTIGVMTAIGESGLRVLDRGDKVGPDSRGLFQQRANGAWGSYADRMDPYISATNFFKALQQVPGWQQMTPTQAAHATQHNADPNYYTRFWAPAQQIVAALGGGLPPSATCPTDTPVQAQPGPGGWVAPAIGRLTSGFGSRWGTHHDGQDIANNCGTPIYAAGPGTVISAGPASGYGNWIRIDHGGGVVTIYGHMPRSSITVAVGEHVDAGDQIAEIGNEGQSTGCHLHVQVEVNGRPVDPIAFLAQHDVALAA